MKQYLYCLLAFLAIACAYNSFGPQGSGIKNKPEYVGTDPNPDLQIILKEFKSLSIQYNIKFTKEVTVGFSDIKGKSVVGTCTYGSKFREIDIDKKYWNSIPWNYKMALVYHELAHCYCYRDHDYGKGKLYPSTFMIELMDILDKYRPPTGLRDGMMSDNCPMSLMYPYVVGSYCFSRHYSHYVEEMFERCEPY